MKISTNVEMEVDARIVRDETAGILVVVEHVTTFEHPLAPAAPLRDIPDVGFDGLEGPGVVIDIIDPAQVPDGMSDDDILEAYFNGLYGVA